MTRSSPMCRISHTNNHVEQAPLYANLPNLPFMMNPAQQPLLFPSLLANASQIVEPAFAGPVLSMRPNHQPRQRRMVNERDKFLLLIKMIFLYLERSYNIDLLDKAKQVIQRCVQYNRQGEGRFMPLKHAVETRLEALLGIEFFAHMQRCLEANCERSPCGHFYITRRNISPTPYA